MHTAIVDVRQRSAVWKAIAEGVDELCRLDIVVANAGICAMGKGQTIQSWSDTLPRHAGHADSRYITGTQLRVDAGGFVKAKPFKG